MVNLANEVAKPALSSTYIILYVSLHFVNLFNFYTKDK